MLTNTDRLAMIHRLQQLTHELSHLTQMLQQNPFPITDEDIHRGVTNMIDQGRTVVLSDLNEMMRDGLPITVLATYHPNSKQDRKLISRSEHVDATLERMILRLIELEYVTYVGETPTNLDAYAVQLKEPAPEETDEDGEALMHRIEFISTDLPQPHDALVRIGPRGRVRYLMTDEDIKGVLMATANIGMLQLERSVTQQLQDNKDSDEEFYVVVRPVTSDATA